MKIGFVLDDTLDTSDGVQQYVLLLSGWLKDHGHEVHYLVGATKRRDIVGVHSLSRNLSVRFNKNRLSIPIGASSRRIAELLEEQQFDVLHVQMPYSPLLSGRIIKQASSNTAIVGTFHIAPHNYMVTAATKLLGWWQRWQIKRFNKVIAVSSVAQRFASMTMKINSQVIPNAIDLSTWQLQRKTAKTYDIIFVGRLVKRKGCIHLLRAINQLVNDYKIKNLRVVIVGDGPEKNKLQAYIDSHNLRKIVSFAGFVSEKRKRELLQGSKIAVYPATGGESFGIVLLEAMAAGAVVLAGNNPGYSSVMTPVPEALFEPSQFNDLANQLQRGLSDERYLANLHKKQQQIVKQYDINVVGNAILKTYKQALRHK